MASPVLSWWAALIGLAVAIILILRKLNPVYSLLLGAVIGALLGGANLVQTIDILIKGSQSVMGTVLRVLAAGMLAGVMMESGAADTLARAIVKTFGDRWALLALAVASMVITAVGVFIPVAVLIVAPIALEVGKRMGFSKLSLLVALSGGGKAGEHYLAEPQYHCGGQGVQRGIESSHDRRLYSGNRGPDRGGAVGVPAPGQRLRRAGCRSGESRCRKFRRYQGITFSCLVAGDAGGGDCLAVVKPDWLHFSY